MVCASLSVETFADAPDELALDEVQAFVGGVDDEDVLVAPATLLHRFEWVVAGWGRPEGAGLGGGGIVM
jgi:hypothetical protein